MQTTIDYALEEVHEEEVHERDGKHILMSLTFIGKNRGKNNGILLTRILEQWRRNNVKNDVTTALVLNRPLAKVPFY